MESQNGAEVNGKHGTLFRSPRDTKAVLPVLDELDAARVAFPGRFASAHEGFAVLLEEVEELKAEVFRRQDGRDVSRMRKEAVQVAAMALRFVVDICNAADPAPELSRCQLSDQEDFLDASPVPEPRLLDMPAEYYHAAEIVWAYDNSIRFWEYLGLQERKGRIQVPVPDLNEILDRDEFQVAVRHCHPLARLLGVSRKKLHAIKYLIERADPAPALQFFRLLERKGLTVFPGLAAALDGGSRNRQERTRHNLKVLVCAFNAFRFENYDFEANAARDVWPSLMERADHG